MVIIGAARSGTKFLRGVLTASDDVKAIPYDVNYIWRSGLEDRPDDAFDAKDVTEEGARRIRDALERAAGAPGATGIVLEKTVSNTLRVEFVAAVLPEAKFVHLVRDGRDVAESAARMWQAPPDWKYLARKLAAFPLRNVAYGWWYASNLLTGLLSRGRGVRVWGPRYPGIEEDAAQLGVLELCARQWRMSVSLARDGLARLPSKRVHTLRYEDLVSDRTALLELLAFLELAQPERVVARYEQTVRRSDTGKWRRHLSVQDQDRLVRELAPLLDELGYV